MNARNWISGAWSDSGTVKDSRSPSDGTVLGRYVDASADAARAAIGAARQAFDETSWSRDASLRSRAMLELADQLQSRTEAMALMLAREGGKVLPQTMWEVSLAVTWLRYNAALALTENTGTAAEVAPGVFFQSIPEPIGVAGIISPWNSPVILSVRAIGPALASGCTVVLKMPGQTALTNGMFCEAVAATSLPPGVLNIFSESGNVGAPIMVESPDVDAISYTGSTKVGRAISAAGAKTLKRVNVELGGKTPMIVFGDADLDAALPHLVLSLIAMNGQFCVTGSRVLVQHSVADELRSRLAQAVASVQVGRSEDPASQIGPLIDAASVQRVDRMVEEATSYAKVLVRGGPILQGPLATGAFYRPSLLEVQDLSVPLVQEELFGPVQTFEVFADEKEAIHRANATQYGLGAAVFSRDEARARRVSREIKAGVVWINCWGVLSEKFEQGGFKQSGVGLLCGPRGLQEFQELKVYVHSAVR